jgi:predicted MFS family arabinose efflux permease
MTAAPPAASRAHADWLPGAVAAGYTTLTAVAAFWLPLYFADELKFSGAQIGVLFSLNAAAGVAAALPAGWGNDRVTSRTLLIGALATQAVLMLLLGRISAFAAVGLVFFLWSMTNALVRMSLELQVLKTDTGERTSGRLAFFVSSRFGGLALGTVLAGYVLRLWDFRFTLQLMGALCLALIALARPLPPTRLAKTALADYVADLRNPRVVLFTGWLFLFATHWGAESTCYSLFLRKELGLTLAQMGWYMAAEFIAVVIAARIAGNHLSGERSFSGIAVAGLLASGIGHMGMVYGDPWVSVAFRTLHGAGDGALMVVMYLGIARLFHIERLGGSAGAVTLAMMCGQIAGALIAGPLGQHYHYSWPLFGSGVLTVLLAAPVVWRRAKAT